MNNAVFPAGNISSADQNRSAHNTHNVFNNVRNAHNIRSAQSIPDNRSSAPLTADRRVHRKKVIPNLADSRNVGKMRVLNGVR